jgi:hypothetical protein
MTIRMRHRNRSVPVNAEQARYAIEVLFQPQRPGGETADVDVVVKRRRIASTDDHVSGEHDAQVMADEVRAPRVFQVERRPEGQESLSEARLDGQPRLSSSAVAQVKRRRRRLNGEVTIIRPPSQSVGEGASSTEGAPTHEDGRFGVALEAQRRHEKLLARIALLERQADKARNAEAATAIRWITKAIKDYGISAEELGLSAA